MADDRFPWFPCEPEKLLVALSGLDSDQQLIYLICLLRIYETGGPITDSSEVLARRSHLSKGRAEKALVSLLDVPNKLFKTEDGRLMNPVAAATLQTMRVRREYAVKTGVIGADTKWRKNRERASLRSDRLSSAREKGIHTEEEWAALVKFCDGKCLRCGKSEVTKDHIVAISAGGSDAIENLQPLCQSCNASKGPSEDLRPADWKKSILSMNGVRGPHAGKPGYLQVEEQDSLFPSGNRAPRSKPDPKPPKQMTALEIARKELFDRGKQVLGEGAGGMVQNLLSAKHGNVALARAAVEHASTMDDPRQYIGGILRGGTNGKAKDALGGFSGLGARLRQSVADDEGLDLCEPSGGTGPARGR